MYRITLFRNVKSEFIELAIEAGSVDEAIDIAMKKVESPEIDWTESEYDPSGVNFVIVVDEDLSEDLSEDRYSSFAIPTFCAERQLLEAALAVLEHGATKDTLETLRLATLLYRKESR